MNAKQTWQRATTEERQKIASDAGLNHCPTGQWDSLGSWWRRQICFSLEGCDVAECDRNNDQHQATYCPEDDKLRLYINTYDGRVERETFNALRKAGYKSTPKQDCQFVAPWSIRAENMALALIAEGDDIGDEDYSPQERAADRAERFSDYRDKRRGEAVGFADTYDAGPDIVGHQNQAKADRGARRQEQYRSNTLTQWDKAEYWHRRTEGVISHALHRSSATVRRGRIKTIESDIRGVIAGYTPYTTKDHPEPSLIMQKDWDGNECEHVYISTGGRGGAWVPVQSLQSRKESSERYLRHLDMRLAYERQMLDSQGGAVDEVGIVPGGWFGVHQVHRVNKSPATGKPTSVMIKGQWGHVKIGNRQCYVDHANRDGLAKLDITRLGEDAYRAPTAEELAEFQRSQKAAKSTKKAMAKKSPPLINPTAESAQRMQEMLNAHERDNDGTTVNSTQAAYSSNSKGGYARCETVTIGEKGVPIRNYYHSQDGSYQREGVFKIRIYRNDGHKRIVILTDKPQKALPFEKIAEARANHPTEESHAQAFYDLWQKRSEWGYEFGGLPEDERAPAKQLRQDAGYLGWASISCANQFSLTDRGAAVLAKCQPESVCF